MPAPSLPPDSPDPVPRPSGSRWSGPRPSVPRPPGPRPSGRRPSGPRPSGPRPSAPGQRAHRTGRLTDIDSRDVTSLLRITFWFAPVCILILSFLWYTLWIRGSISGAQFGIFLVLDFPLAALGVLVINDFGSRLDAAGTEDTLPTTGKRTAAPTYAHQESHVTRGEYRQAVEAYRDHLMVEPHDNEARLRLAFLLESRFADDAGAETLYKQVQARRPSPREEAAATTGLMDQYRRTGRTDRLMVELARFAARFQGTTAGEAARRELAELKRDSGGSREAGAGKW